MKKIYSAERKDPKDVLEACKAGYHIEHPEQINGFVGLCMNYGDIYVTDQIADRMNWQQEFKEFVLKSLDDFKNDEYGDVSDNDEYNNIEDKWIAGGWDLFGRYPSPKISSSGKPYDYIKIRFYHGNTYVYYDSDLEFELMELAKKK